MRKLFGATFWPPTRPQTPGDRRRGEEWRICKQPEDDLDLSEVHTKLDEALKILKGSVGYSLLDDLRPQPGGSARLRRPSAEARRRPVRPMREPKDGPRSSLQSDGSVKELVAATKEDDSQWEDELAEAKAEVTAAAAKYAHYDEDLMLVTRFTFFIGEQSPGAADKVRHEQLYKTVLQGLRLMHLCDYDYSDVVVVMAHASVYFRSTFEAIGHKMSQHEAAHVCVLLIYLAHSFVLDETCPLRCWQKHIFRKYCTLKVLDAALFRLFKMRGYALRITEEEERAALLALFGHSKGASRSSSSGAMLNGGGAILNGKPEVHPAG